MTPSLAICLGYGQGLPALIGWVLLAAGMTAGPLVVSVVSDHDTSIYSGSGTGQSNGGGAGFIVGTNNSSEFRRGLIAFDLTGIPADAVIEEASLKMTLAMAPLDDIDRVVSLHCPATIKNSVSDN